MNDARNVSIRHFILVEKKRSRELKQFLSTASATISGDLFPGLSSEMLQQAAA